ERGFCRRSLSERNTLKRFATTSAEFPLRLAAAAARRAHPEVGVHTGLRLHLGVVAMKGLFPAAGGPPVEKGGLRKDYRQTDEPSLNGIVPGTADITETLELAPVPEGAVTGGAGGG